MLDKAIDMSAHKPVHTIIFQRDAGRAILDPSRGDLDWNDEMQRIRLAGKQFKDYVPVESNHPLYILYTSGTTGLPKVPIRPIRNISSVQSCFYFDTNNKWPHPH
jgi:acyl-coenzyme A synthetase/AMP-(fatty) acid ligase